MVWLSTIRSRSEKASFTGFFIPDIMPCLDPCESAASLLLQNHVYYLHLGSRSDLFLQVP
jgi:hypothetical protein